MRTFGVEEEFLVVDETTGRPLPLGGQIVELNERHDFDARFALTTEIQCEQIEVVTAICDSLDMLETSLRSGRSRADFLARQLGSRIVALGTSPVPVKPHITPTRRYTEIAARFGLTTHEQLTCGHHVHVAVASDEEGVGVLDRIRVWLPVLLALSVNSPYWNGCDTGYASYRRAVWSRLPLAGPTELFGSAASYHRHVEDLVGTNVLVDEGMAYFDARLCRNHPTVEIRVADVSSDSDVAVLIAALARALVETASRQWAAGDRAPNATSAVVELAMWRASKSGLQGELLDPNDWRPRRAADVVAALFDHVRSALAEFGDEHRAIALLDRLLVEGTGAQRQRESYRESGKYSVVVAEAAYRTHI